MATFHTKYNTELFLHNLQDCNKSEYEKMRTTKNSVLGQFSWNEFPEKVRAMFLGEA